MSAHSKTRMCVCVQMTLCLHCHLGSVYRIWCQNPQTAQKTGRVAPTADCGNRPIHFVEFDYCNQLQRSAPVVLFHWVFARFKKTKNVRSGAPWSGYIFRVDLFRRLQLAFSKNGGTQQTPLIEIRWQPYWTIALKWWGIKLVSNWTKNSLLIT